MQPKTGVSFEMLKAQFQQKQAADLANKNARAQAVMDALNNRARQIESSASYLVMAKELAAFSAVLRIQVRCKKWK